MPYHEAGMEPNPLVEVPAPGGILGSIPFTPQWVGAQMAEAVALQYPETVITYPDAPDVVAPFVEGAKDIATTAIVVTAIAGTVAVLGLGIGSFVVWRLTR